MRAVEVRERATSHDPAIDPPMMTVGSRGIVVQKYGGSSVATVEKIRAVAEKIVATRNEGFQLVVVVSAMGKTTDSLLDLARGVTDAPPAREMDMLLSSGERISCSLLAMAIQGLGVPAVSLTGPQCGIRTDDAHASARIVEVNPERMHRELAAGRVVVVAGFQGESPRREVTTLGRGGSDATAVALAAALTAERCDIFSDVDGVYTTDPRVCGDATRIPRLGYEEMKELARQGAKVLNTHAVELAEEGGVAIHARSTFGGLAHSVIDGPKGCAEGPRVVGVTGRKDLWRVTYGADAVSTVSAAVEGCDVRARRFESDGGVELVIATTDLPEAPALRRALVERGAQVEDALGSVAVVGAGVGESPELGRSALRALDVQGIAVLTGFCVPTAVTYVVAHERVDDAVRALHGVFCQADAGDDRRVA